MSIHSIPPRLKTVGIVAASLAVGVIAGAFVISGGQSGEAGPAGARGPGGPGDAQQRPPAVTLVHPETAPIDQVLTAIGTGRALQSLTLNAEVDGIIKEILITPGEMAKAGEPLILMDNREQEIAVARSRAEFNIAKTNATRFEGLVEDEAASALEYEATQNQLAATTAAMRQAEYELSRRTIRAPFAGIVGLTQLDVGDYVTSGTALTTIDDVSSLLVDFVIPESASPFVRIGLDVKATAQASGGRTVTGRIRAIDSRIDPASRTRRVEAVLANQENLLIPGSTFSISLDVPGRQAIVLPGLAVQWDRAGAYVWRADANGAAERVPVVILQRNADTVQVEAALSPSDLIVGEGADLVRPGAPLRQRGADASVAGGNAAATAQ
jgi:RND family efflux transporter MFP subunit